MSSPLTRQQFVRKNRTSAKSQRKAMRRGFTRLRVEGLEGRLLLNSTPLGLVPFASAQELEQFLVKDALQRYEHLFGQPAYWCWPTLDLYATNGVRTEALPAAEPAQDHSETNTQVAGVDEGDIVETDGDYLYVLSHEELVILDAWPGNELHVESRVAIEGRPLAEYLSGDWLTILSDTGENGWLPGPMDTMFAGVMCPVPWPAPKLTVTVLDVSDREAPQVVQQTELDGTLVDSRAIDNHVYVVMANGFRLPGPELLPSPEPLPGPEPPHVLPVDPSGGAESTGLAADVARMPVPWPPGQNYVYETQEQYLARITGHVLDLGLPHYACLGADGQVVESGLLSEATDIYRPTSSDDTLLTSVVVFDATSDEPGPVSSTSVPASNVSEVYVSQESIYLLEAVWGDAGSSTAILQLDIDPTGANVEPSAVGAVPGRIINQFAVDEHAGFLRIATTQGWGDDAASGVYVLQKVGGALNVVGQLDDLAPGEEIYSARFQGDFGFLVTFQRVDPLFTIDLSDPTQPGLAGELEIPGFSNYLQALGDGYLIGVGRNADPTSGAWQEPQISLFDVADLETPQLLDRFSIDVGPWGWLEAFSDHHAISYYPEYRVLTLSVTSSGQWVEALDGTGEYLPPETDLWVFKIDMATDSGSGVRQGAIELLGRIQHDAPVRRSVRIENLLYSVSADTVSVHEILNPQVEIARVYYGDRMTDLGVVDWVQLVDSSFEPTDPWYAFEATRDGSLAVEVSSPAGPNSVNLTLFDEDLRPLANSTAANGSQRIDWRTDAQAKYFVRVSQFAGSAQADDLFALRVGNLVQEDGDTLTVYGTEGNDRLDLNRAAAIVNGMRYPFDRAKIASVTLDGAAGNDTYRLATRGLTVAIVDSAGVDTLDFSRSSGALRLDLAQNEGQSQRIGAGNNTLSIRGTIENAVGTPFADTIFGNSANNRLDGQAGDDRLFGRAGNDYLLGGLGSDRLFGEAGNDILLGGMGNDRLVDDLGRNLLIGGRGKDRLVGSPGGDILIGGTTSYDSSRAALGAILAEWNSGGSLAGRLANLTNGGGRNGRFALSRNRTAQDDAACDVLLGGLGRDWLLLFNGDLATDLGASAG